MARRRPQGRNHFRKVCDPPAEGAGFNPDQPRHPKGTPEGGQWSGGSGSQPAIADAGKKPEPGITDPRVLSDATPDNDWKPGAQYTQNTPSNIDQNQVPPPGGHHFVPRALYRDLPLPAETQKVFDQARTGPLNAEIHGWSKAHRLYNDAVEEHFDRFLSENNIRPEQMTPEQARDFVDKVKRSSDPRIRGLNLRIYWREIKYWLGRVPRGIE